MPGRCKFVVMTPMGRVFSRHDVSSMGFKKAVAEAVKESKDYHGRSVDVNLDCGGSPGMRHSGIFLVTCYENGQCNTGFSGQKDGSASSIRIAGVRRRKRR